MKNPNDIEDNIYCLFKRQIIVYFILEINILNIKNKKAVLIHENNHKLLLLKR